MLTPQQRYHEGICTSLVLDLDANDGGIEHDITASVESARESFQKILKADPTFNYGFEPGIIVIGKNADKRNLSLAYHAGAYPVDLDTDQDREDMLRFINNAIVEYCARKPIVEIKRTPEQEAALAQYYKPMHDGEETLIGDFLKHINSN